MELNVLRCLYRWKTPGYGIIGKLSENLTRSRRCIGEASFYNVTGNPGRQNVVLILKSEDLPCAYDLHRLRTMALCKNRLIYSISILPYYGNAITSCSSDYLPGSPCGYFLS